KDSRKLGAKKDTSVLDAYYHIDKSSTGKIIEPLFVLEFNQINLHRLIAINIACSLIQEIL
ncbi:MAG: hypothetical protein ACTHXQ_08555, partial [Lactobacillus helveticus]